MARRRRKQLPQGSFPATIESLSHDGRGVAHIDGKVTFIPTTLQGEEIQFHYSYRSRKHDEGILDSVDKASDERVEAGCAHFGICGGCSLQHMAAEAQMAYKQEALMDAFERIGNVTPEAVAAPLHSEPWGYRRKARLGVRHVFKKGRVLVGFRERGTSYLADIRHCKVLHPSVGEHLEALGDMIMTLSISEQLPQIEVAVGDDATVMIFRILEPLTESDEKTIADFCAQREWTPYLQDGGPQTVKPLHDAATLTYSLPQESLQFEFLPNDFTQVNSDINRQMISQAMEWLDLQGDEKVLDLFCGLGNFTLPLARRAESVHGVEGDTVLVERARQNAIRNSIDNVSFDVANLYDEETPAFKWAKQKYDAVLLDPPRSGALEMMPLVAKMGAEKILYVSCYPGTLARDADVLVNQHGYRMVKAGVMDMFPHTAHVESMALFVKD
ncbi:23S rRNA (uracil(1939)-C(5))-methyltransferase [Solemya velum gill symbiont]|uniref:23S rRNA (uracil(1939)-C(5))-methyltransferase RlmD n=1 Tax=Solemya velum gill symbiont TaxID=2340 RepID=UPI000997D90B|nr:23S rRNA (uracil(1939)-C(5))-methyltransferase RlmD [Solemya velum gill symbiont]OOZ15678.1 23S rRNA (uracil(1939)-C(5))-methyltransferase [Solemya velum gill symbiont]OOZ18217.1 23S rRNA (uracil(1939)-C(5))-methyltransferase [Solemya velum gill symbiont]OOZ20490.1 23S rRNA (uracil(1939)-C(5))-methyltransferase [Solemya velum gill symbiont]OOZ22364.1 23S rRNA (uracil(1939)-C(5))-methyltransferase [Solemya velum gill symbiont]OOZ24640.1 23S rRNA (uracil(1939)-C(5))-methyltransferase [Solemya